MNIRAMTALAAAALAPVAMADVYEWEWNVGDPGSYSTNNVAGTFESIEASYNDVTHEFSWKVVFSDQKTDGITLAVNNGPNPKGEAGELALLYIDAAEIATPRMTAYGYNGKNSRDSFKDGDGNTGGNQAPDNIESLADTSWINSLSVTDNAGKRTFSFNIDASGINSHSPLYPNGDPWRGIMFEDKLGLWMHTYENLKREYDGNGLLTQWDRDREGWFDGKGFVTTVVPLPTPVMLGLVGLGGAVIVRRRMK